jgi:acetyltransferase-like isoleucine patch superfamily enzyme
MGVAVLKKTRVEIQGVNNTIFIDDLSRLHNCSIHIQGSNNTLKICKEVYLHQTEICMEDDGNCITINDNTSIFGSTHLAAIEGTSISIGRDCMFSSNIHMRTGDSHSITDLSGRRLNTSESIVIGDHVWVCTRVLCLKGVQVADHSVIGAGSLVTRRFGEGNVVLAGNPARIVKRGVDWRRERIYTEKEITFAPRSCDEKRNYKTA